MGRCEQELSILDMQLNELHRTTSEMKRDLNESKNRKEYLEIRIQELQLEKNKIDIQNEILKKICNLILLKLCGNSIGTPEEIDVKIIQLLDIVQNEPTQDIQYLLSQLTGVN